MNQKYCVKFLGSKLLSLAHLFRQSERTWKKKLNLKKYWNKSIQLIIALKMDNSDHYNMVNDSYVQEDSEPGKIWYILCNFQFVYVFIF